jgi:hypothetical protein
LQVGDTGPVESARRSNSRVLGSPFSGLSGQIVSLKLKKKLARPPVYHTGLNEPCPAPKFQWPDNTFKSMRIHIPGSGYRSLLFVKKNQQIFR